MDPLGVCKEIPGRRHLLVMRSEYRKNGLPCQGTWTFCWPIPRAIPLAIDVALEGKAKDAPSWNESFWRKCGLCCIFLVTSTATLDFLRLEKRRFAMPVASQMYFTTCENQWFLKLFQGWNRVPQIPTKNRLGAQRDHDRKHQRKNDAGVPRGRLHDQSFVSTVMYIISPLLVLQWFVAWVSYLYKYFQRYPINKLLPIWSSA